MPRRGPLLLAAGAVLAVAVIGGGVLIASGSEPNTDSSATTSPPDTLADADTGPQGEQAPPETIISPPKEGTENLLDTALAAGFTHFAEAVRIAGLEDVLRQGGAQGQLTVFAPTDEWFEAASAEVAPLLADPARLRAVLESHILPETLLVADFRVAAGNPRPTLGPEPVLIERAGSGWTLGGDVAIVVQMLSLGEGNDVPDAGIQAANGVIHPVEGLRGLSSPAS